MTNNEANELRFSVIVTISRMIPPPCVSGIEDEVWGEEQVGEVKYGAVLSPQQFWEMCEDLGLSADCSTAGALGAPGFAEEHLVPAVSFGGDEGSGSRCVSVYLTPWTENVKREALEVIAGESVEEVRTLGAEGFGSTRMIALPLWGEDWGRIEEILLAWFADGIRYGVLTTMEGDPLREATILRLRDELRVAEERLVKCRSNVDLECRKISGFQEKLGDMGVSSHEEKSDTGEGK